MSEDDIIYWQDVLEAVQGHQSEIPKCPFCYKGDIKVTELGWQPRPRTRVECTRCGQFLEGSFNDEYYEMREKAEQAERVASQKPLPMK